MLDGKAAYDTSFQGAGGFGLFYYPPTFIPLILPFGLLAAGHGDLALDRAARRGVRDRASRVLPVSGADAVARSSCSPGLSWPFLYAVKLGQVGPILFLLFAAGWRGIGRRSVLGVSGGARGGDQDPARRWSCCGRS